MTRRFASTGVAAADTALALSTGGASKAVTLAARTLSAAENVERIVNTVELAAAGDFKQLGKQAAVEIISRKLPSQAGKAQRTGPLNAQNLDVDPKYSGVGIGDQVPTKKPSLTAHKKALERVHEQVGKLPKGPPGKKGSPQHGDPTKGYRLDPGHPNRPPGDPEAGPHFNWWDYTEGKRRGGRGRKGTIPIED